MTVETGAAVVTNALNAPAILVQSLGGDGQIVTTSGAYNGTLGGNGAAGGAAIGGAVNITVNATVSAQGQASAGIYAQSAGQGYGNNGQTGGSPILITVGQGGSVSGGQAEFG